VVERPKASNVFARLNTGIMCPNSAIVMYVRVFSVFVESCVDIGLAIGCVYDSQFQLITDASGERA
jgi:hypothetical protein